MNSVIFAAHAGHPVSGPEFDGVDLLESPSQSNTDGLLNPFVSADVRKLVTLHDRGRFDAFEVKDTSYKALLDLSKYLDTTLGKSTQTGLSAELMAQAVKFIKSVPAEQVFLRLEVTDKKPNVPDFNPAHMCAYDSERSYGTDYLQIARRLTIFGSTSSVMNNTDLGTFLEKGRKKCVVLYMGTQKNDDVQILDPSHAMALNIVVAGIAESADAESLEKTTEEILLHPEISDFQQEATELKVLLTEFRNNLDPELGKEIATRLISLQSGLENLSEAGILTEFLSPLIDLVETMASDDMVQEIVEHFDLSIGVGIPQELETLQAAIDIILADASLSKEEQGQRITTLLQVSVPSVLEGGDGVIEHLKVFLNGLQDTLKNRDVPLPFPLLESPVSWEPSHSEKLADLVLLLSDPAQIEAIKDALQKTPEGLEIIKSLEQISSVLDLETPNRDTLVAKIHEALTAPTPETALLTKDLLQVISLTSHPEIIYLLPESIQLSSYSFTLDTLSAQHGLAASGITETIARITNGEVKFEFTPPYTLPVNGNDFIVLPFLVQPAMVAKLSSIPADQVENYFEKISDPVLRKHLQEQYEAIQILQAIDHLRGDDGKLPPNITAMSVSEITFSYAESRDFPKALDVLLEKMGDIPSVVSSLSRDGPEGIKIAEALERLSSTLDFENTDKAVLIGKIQEILASPTNETASIANDLKYVIGTMAASDPQMAALLSVPTQTSLPLHTSFDTVGHPSLPQALDALDIISENVGRLESKVAHESISTLSHYIQNDPAFLSSLPQEKQQFIAAVVTKSTIEKIVSDNVLPAEFRRELKSALQSKDPEKLAQAINKAAEFYPPNRTPPALAVLKAVAPALAVVSLVKNDPKIPPVRPVESEPHRPIIITPEGYPIPSNPKSDPIKPPVPQNDNPPPEPTPSDPTLKPEHKPPEKKPSEPTPSPNHDPAPTNPPPAEDPPVKRPVCPVTGDDICLCNEFKKAVGDMKEGDEKTLKEGVVIRVTETTVDKDGNKKTTYTVSDNDNVIFEGDADEIEKQIEENERKLAEKDKENAGKFEKDKEVVGIDVKSTEQVETGNDGVQKSENANDDNVDFNFGDEEPSTPSQAHLTGLSPK